MNEAEVQQLLEKVRAGDPEAKDVLLREAHDRVLGMAHDMVRPYPEIEAEDVLQEAFLKLHSAVDDLPSSEVSGFLNLCGMIVRQVLLDMRRR